MSAARLVILVSLCSAPAMRADQILWSFDMTELPPDWEIAEGQWSFGPDGAYSSANADSFEQDWNQLRSSYLVLPPGTDSISIAAGQTSYAWSSGIPGTFSFARLVLQVNGQGYIVWNNAQGSDPLPIYIIPDSAAAGDSLRFDFICAAVSWPETGKTGMQEAVSEFLIWDFVVTAFGDVSDFDHRSWAGIKNPGY